MNGFHAQIIISYVIWSKYVQLICIIINKRYSKFGIDISTNNKNKPIVSKADIRYINAIRYKPTCLPKEACEASQ